MDLTLFVGPLLGALALAGVIYQSVQNRKNNQDTVGVSRREAGTHEFTAITAGFVAQVAMLSKIQEDQQAQITDLQEQLASIRTERSEILEHLKTVEKLVPTPPGVPLRPAWT